MKAYHGKDGENVRRESSHSLQQKLEDYVTMDLLSDYGHWTDVLHNAEALKAEMKTGYSNPISTFYCISQGTKMSF